MKTLSLDLQDVPLSQLISEYPILEDFCKVYDIPIVNNSRSLKEELFAKPSHFWDECHLYIWSGREESVFFMTKKSLDLLDKIADFF